MILTEFLDKKNADKCKILHVLVYRLALRKVRQCRSGMVWGLPPAFTCLLSLYPFNQMFDAFENKIMRFITKIMRLLLDFRFWVWSVGRSPSGLSAFDLKVTFPVVICPVLTVYFLTYMLLCVPRSDLFQKIVLFCKISSTLSYRVFEAYP